MSECDGLYVGAAAVERYRHRNLLSSGRHTAGERIAIAKRELATVTHIPGDLSLADIDRRFKEALAMIRWRRHAATRSAGLPEL